MCLKWRRTIKEEKILSGNKIFALIPIDSTRAVGHIVLKTNIFLAVDNEGRVQIKTEKHSCENVNCEMEQFNVNSCDRPKDEKIFVNKI